MINGIVVEHNGIDSKLFSDLFLQFPDARNKRLPDIVAEIGNHIRIIVHSAHAVVAQLNEIPVSHLFCHGVTDLYQAVVNIVQLVRIGFQTPADCLTCLAAHLAVFIFQLAAQNRQRHIFSLIVENHAGHEGGVFGDNGIFLLQFLDNRRGECLFGNAVGSQHPGIDVFFKLFAEGRIQ